MPMHPLFRILIVVLVLFILACGGLLIVLEASGDKPPETRISARYG